MKGMEDKDKKEFSEVDYINTDSYAKELVEEYKACAEKMTSLEDLLRALVGAEDCDVLEAANVLAQLHAIQSYKTALKARLTLRNVEIIDGKAIKVMSEV